MITITAFDYVVEWEGKYLTDDPDDPGGVTNYGITLPTLKRLGIDVDGDGDVDVDDIVKLSEQSAFAAYDKLWDLTGAADLDSQRSISGFCVVKFFDTCVNLGKYQAVLILQRTINAISAYGQDRDKWIVVDGILGPKTLQAFWQLGQNNDGTRASFFMRTFCSEQAGVYRMIVYKKPTLKKYLSGWLRRAYSDPLGIICTTDSRYLR